MDSDCTGGRMAMQFDTASQDTISGFMEYVKIKVIKEGTEEDFQRWKEHMLEVPKCWNEFCYCCYEKENLKSVHITKVGDETNSYITTLCTDCINEVIHNEILVNEDHLMIKSQE